jgi:hypothetical protein
MDGRKTLRTSVPSQYNIAIPPAPVNRTFKVCNGYFVIDSYRTSRFSASRYFSPVFAMIPVGSSGAGGFWFQWMEIR